MVIYFGADHRGLTLKDALKQIVHDWGYEVHDEGDTVLDTEDDYVDFARKVAERVGKAPETDRGVLVCGSGVGVDIVANKIRGVRSVLGFSPDQVYSARHDDNVNVLSISAEFIAPENAKKMLQIFLETPFGNDDRFKRRLSKIKDIEHG